MRIFNLFIKQNDLRPPFGWPLLHNFEYYPVCQHVNKQGLFYKKFKYQKSKLKTFSI